METPFFPAFRARLAALGKRVQFLRQQNLLHLDKLFAPLLPAGLLSQAEEGPNGRDRIYSVRRTFFGFLYQVLNPDWAQASGFAQRQTSGQKRPPDGLEQTLVVAASALS